MQPAKYISKIREPLRSYAAERAAWRGDEEALLAEKKALDEELSVAMRKVRGRGRTARSNSPCSHQR